MINKKLLFSAILILFVVLIDQILKIWIKTTMTLGDEIVIFEWFKLHFVENEGMAFSMKLGGQYGKLALTLFRIVAVGFLSYWLYTLSQQAKIGKNVLVSLSLITAGALGNIIDCVFYGVLFSESNAHAIATFMPPEGGYAPLLHGKVVDMFLFPLYEGFLPQWLPLIGGNYFSFFNAIFNIADAAITVGVVLILIFQRSLFQTEEEQANPQPNTTDT